MASFAKVFAGLIDYLPSKGKHAAYDKDVIKRMEDIEVLDSDTKTVLFNIIDTYLRDAKARNVYGK